jgi:hypothetical protein
VSLLENFGNFLLKVLTFQGRGRREKEKKEKDELLVKK